MFVAGFIGFVLDNTISGTDEERGLTKRAQAELDARLAGDTSYDFPYGMDAIKRYAIFYYYFNKILHDHCRIKWLRFLPISPTYEKDIIEFLPFCKKRKAQPNNLSSGNTTHL